MTQKNQQVLAYVLHSKPYLENSLILQLFSLELGCFSLIAKGIKGKSSQARRAILQPFLELKIEFTGKSDLKTLLHCELNNQASLNSPLLNLQGKLLACGYYANELILRACPATHEYPELFYQYRSFIQELKTNLKSASGDINSCELNPLSSKPMQTILREFEVGLLTAIGIAPDWFFDTNQMPIESEKEYIIYPESGFQLAEPLPNYDILGQKEQNYSRFQGHSILSLATGEQSPEYFKSSQQITALFLREVIGDRPLQSRKLWQSLSLN